MIIFTPPERNKIFNKENVEYALKRFKQIFPNDTPALLICVELKSIYREFMSSFDISVKVQHYFGAQNDWMIVSNKMLNLLNEGR